MVLDGLSVSLRRGAKHTAHRTMSADSRGSSLSLKSLPCEVLRKTVDDFLGLHDVPAVLCIPAFIEVLKESKLFQKWVVDGSHGNLNNWARFLNLILRRDRPRKGWLQVKWKFFVFP